MAISALLEERLSRLLAEYLARNGEIPLSEEFKERHKEEYEEIARVITSVRMNEILDRVSKTYRKCMARKAITTMNSNMTMNISGLLRKTSPSNCHHEIKLINNTIRIILQ